MEFVAAAVLIVIGVVAVSLLRKQARRKRLMEKYGVSISVEN
jgi:hypothetical protein